MKYATRIVFSLLALSLASSAGCTTPRRLDVGLDLPDGGDGDAPDAPSDAPRSDTGLDAPDAPLCTPVCESASSLIPCAGAKAESCLLGCVTDPIAHCAQMVISNVDAEVDGLTLIPTTTSGTGTIDTTACTWSAGLTSLSGTVVTMAEGGDACVFRFEALTVAGGGTVRAVGDLPLIIVAEGELRIAGSLHADSTRGAAPIAGAGSGTGGIAGGAGDRLSGSGSGGGGGGMSTRGGDGGDANTGAADGGLGGTATLGITLEPLVGGAAGGIGGTSLVEPALGGAGGGAIQLSSRLRVVIDGYLGAAGAGGDRGGNTESGAGGGGSGGGLLVEAPEIMLLGADINVAGGGGGAGGCLTAGTDGDDATGVNGIPQGGECTFTGGDGGNGAGGSAQATNGTRGGGGGGGAGVVRFRSQIPLPLPGSASLNPRISGPGTAVYSSMPLATR